MKIEFLKDYCFIKKGRKYSLQDFTVLTGRNGAGKTKLLEGIVRGENCKIDGKLRKGVDIGFFNFSNFSNSISDKEFNAYSQHDSVHNRTWQQYQLLKKGKGKINQNIEEVARYFGKDVMNLTEADFKKYPVRRDDERIKLFGLNFFQDSANYISHLESNKFNAFRNKEYTEENNLIYSEDEFIEVYGVPPWERINQIFKDIEINYSFKIPDRTQRRESVKVQLVDTINNQKIEVEGLSSGEKTILSIATFIYNSEIKQNIPDVFLFDEPDALLHPEYSKKLIFILNDYLVKQLNKKVIMTTHSPSTVAIVPEESIFICEKKSFEVRKASKDEALSQLTFNVNFLSISHENRRQVFVEDVSDAQIFEFIKNKILDKLHPEISLNFIPIRVSGTGGKAKVIEMTRMLFKYGNKNVSGIIDWDLEKNVNEFIYVLGEGKRYNIENYILDPVLFYTFLLREKIIPRRNFETKSQKKFFEIKEMKDEELQVIANEIVEFAIKKKPKDASDETMEIMYVNGRKILIPKWFLEWNGHELVEFFEEEFPEIIGLKKRKKSNLTELIVKFVIDDLPGLIPYEFVKLFRQIQQGT